MKKLLSAKILSVIFILAMVFPLSVANASIPPTTNLYVTGFVGAEINVTDLDGNELMVVKAPGFYSKYIKPGTEVLIGWKVEDGISYHVEINGQPQDTSEKQMRITIPGEDQVFNFELVKTDNPFLPSTTNAYPRQEWIADLMDVVDLEYVSSDLHSSFIDVNDENPYLMALEIAKNYSIITTDEIGSIVNNGQEVSGPVIKPQEPTEREFAILTALKALGYVGIDTPSNQYRIATKIGIMKSELNGTTFTTQEAKDMLSVVAQIAAGPDFSGEPQYDIDYQDGVIQFEEEDFGEYSYSFPDGIATDSNKTTTLRMANVSKAALLKAGDIIVLPPNAEYISGITQKIVSITKSDDNFIEFLATIPNPGEFVGDGGIAMRGTADLSSAIFIPADDIMFYSSIDERDASANSSVKTGKWTATLTGSGLEIGYGSDNLKVSALYRPRVEIDTNINADFLGFGWEIENMYCKVINTVELSGTASASVAERTQPLGILKIPVGSSGFLIEGGVQAVVKASGEISVVFTTTMGGGFSYDRDIGVRVLRQARANINITKLEANASFGLQPLFMLTLCDIWDIADIGIEVGPASTASATIRDSKTTCFDCALYLYSSLNALTDSSLLGAFLPYSLDVTMFNSENSPFKKEQHIERTQETYTTVPKCTFGFGKFNVNVVDYSTNTPVACSLVAKQTDSDTDLAVVEITSTSGNIISDDVITGTYDYEITAPGYISYSGNMKITLDETTNIGTIKLIKVGDGTISGTVKNALNSSLISGAKLTLYMGSDINETNVSSAQEVSFTGTNTTSSTGAFNIGVANGYYTLKVEKNGYVTGYQNVSSMLNSPNQNIVLIPDSGGGSDADNIGDLRIVLTWGAAPRDLDSHLCGPTASGVRRFHTYYANKVYSENGKLHAFLDVDDTSSYGPETTTVYDINTSGKYSFYIHDFTNRSSTTSSALSKSEAVVRVYEKVATGENDSNSNPINQSKLIATYYVPVNTPGTLWHVFDYNALTKKIIPKDTMTFLSNSSNVGTARIGDSSIDEEDFNIMLEDMIEKELSLTENGQDMD